VDGFGRNARRATRAALSIVLICVACTATARATTNRRIAASPITSTPAATPLRVPSTVVVRAHDPADLTIVEAFAASKGFTVTQRVPELTALRLRPPRAIDLVRAVTELRARAEVDYAEPAYTMTRADVPTDPLYSKESSYLEAEHAPEAWAVETGKAATLVAVLDTGLDAAHPDLAGRVWTNAREIAGNGEDDDGNGCVDDVNGCAFVSAPSPGCAAALNGNISDDLGHGTFVAGIIAANANGAGMVGVARGVTILPVKVLDCNGEGDSLAVAQGILYAAKAGARVINISLVGSTDAEVLRQAVDVAHDQYGVLIVAAAGNTGVAGVAYPARYPNVLAVGAASADNPDRPAPFSATGPEIAVVAVGQGIVGTVPKSSCGSFLPCMPPGPYAIGDGTSFAAPQVTGLVALMVSHTPALTAYSISSIIKETADPLPAGDRPDWAGAGRINMLKALKPAYHLGAPGVSKN
jgi:subtilisin family serine protease